MDVTHICRQAAYAAKLTKTIYPHLLRYSFGMVTLETLHRDKNPRTAPQNCGVCAHLISEPQTPYEVLRVAFNHPCCEEEVSLGDFLQ
jgi:hypothetical protein